MPAWPGRFFVGVVNFFARLDLEQNILFKKKIIHSAIFKNLGEKLPDPSIKLEI